jgi:predicted RNase H-like HicB family nuclease
MVPSGVPPAYNAPVAAVLQRTIKAVVRPGDESGFVAECLEIPVITQGATLDEVSHNLRDAVALHLEDEDLAVLGLAPDPTILVTLELPATRA